MEKLKLERLSDALNLVKRLTIHVITCPDEKRKTMCHKQYLKAQ
jgi:hypothetical protein